MPDFANPSGRTLTLGERHAALAVAADLDLPVIEDAAYEQLHFDHEPLPSLLALDSAAAGIDAGRVIYCGTFSKTVVPGLRIGWITGRSCPITPRASVPPIASAVTPCWPPSRRPCPQA